MSTALEKNSTNSTDLSATSAAFGIFVMYLRCDLKKKKNNVEGMYGAEDEDVSHNICYRIKRTVILNRRPLFSI